MARNGPQRQSKPGRPLSRRAIFIGSVLMVLVGAVAFGAVHHFYGGGTEHDSAGRDTVRTAGTLVVGVGGFFALLLAARRQRSTEETLEHQREVAVTAARDAVEQRITELYTRAVDQLGAEKAPVRLGGLHALERLAQNNPIQRQTIVDVICAYLRMPYTPPGDQAPGEDASEDVHRRYEQQLQELQVRLTAQRILSAHLKPEPAAAFWADIDLNLTEAHLHQLDLTACCMRKVQFDGATFAGDTDFGGAEFTGTARFVVAKFTGDYTGFREAKFAGVAVFEGAEFAGNGDFGGADFTTAVFAEDATFAGAEFTGNAMFSKAEFAGEAMFGGATFAWNVEFAGTTFAENAELRGARVPLRSFHGVLPRGWLTRPARNDEGWRYVVREEDSSTQPAEPPEDQQMPVNDPF